jgi:hypothetical protein
VSLRSGSEDAVPSNEHARLLQLTPKLAVGALFTGPPPPVGIRTGAKMPLDMSSSRSLIPSPESSTQFKLPLLTKAARISAGVRPLLASRAAAPATCGEAMEVPLMVLKLPFSNG